MVARAVAAKEKNPQKLEGKGGGRPPPTLNLGIGFYFLPIFQKSALFLCSNLAPNVNMLLKQTRVLKKAAQTPVEKRYNLQPLRRVVFPDATDPGRAFLWMPGAFPLLPRKEPEV